MGWKNNWQERPLYIHHHSPKHQYRVFVLIPCCQEIKYVLVIVQLWENPGFRTFFPIPRPFAGPHHFQALAAWRLSRWSPPRENARPASQRRQPVGSRTRPGWSNRPPKAKIVKWFCWCFFRCLLDVYRNWHWIWVTWFTSSWSSDIIWHLTIGSPNAVGLRSSVENCNIGSRCFLLKTKTIDLHPPSSTIIQCQSGCLNSMGFQLTFLRFFQCCVWADGPSGLHRTVKQRPPKRAPWRGPSQRMEWYEYIYVCIYIYTYMNDVEGKVTLHVSSCL